MRELIVNPENLLYAKTHEWVHVATDEAGGKVATVGLSSFAVEALTDLVFIELPEIGREVRAGESFSEIETVPFWLIGQCTSYTWKLSTAGLPHPRRTRSRHAANETPPGVTSTSNRAWPT